MTSNKVTSTKITSRYQSEFKVIIEEITLLNNDAFDVVDVIFDHNHKNIRYIVTAATKKFGFHFFSVYILIKRSYTITAPPLSPEFEELVMLLGILPSWCFHDS